MSDSYNPEVLYGEVMIKPEWTQPSLDPDAIRRNNGVPPPPMPILPFEFTVQLYNPDQQVIVTQKPGSWGASPSYEFSMPQTTFRIPSASALDRTQNDPPASPTTVKLNFVWRKESKLAKDMTCYMTGKSTDTVVKKKHRDPDIPVALYRSFREVTVYEPNLSRVEMEDPKGLEVVLLISAAVIKDLYFSNNINLIFNVTEASALLPHSSNSPGPTGPASAALVQPNGLVANRKALPGHQTTPPISPHPHPLPPLPSGATTADPRQQWEIDAETARLRAQVEAEDRTRIAEEQARRRERERADEAETRRLRTIFEAEQRDARRRQEEVDRETERLRREYGIPSQQPSSLPPPPGTSGRHSAPSFAQHPYQQPQYPPQQQYQQQSQHQYPPQHQYQQQLQHQPPQQSHSRPGPQPPPRGSNGLYIQPSSSHAQASSSAVVMSGANPGASSSSADAGGRPGKKKGFFSGLRSSSDDGQQKVLKKSSAIW